MSYNSEHIQMNEGNIIPEDQKWLYDMLAEQRKTIIKMNKAIQGIIVLIMITMLMVILSI
jgi:hypothetical protein